MQPYLADIQKLFTDWYFLTLESPLYPATIAVIVWLLAVIIYNIKIVFINKKKKSIESAQIELQSKLDESEQQLAKKQAELTEQSTQLEEYQRLNAELKTKNDEHNQNIIKTVKALATKFDLNEQLVKSDKKIKDEIIWQQQDNIIEQLSERIIKEQHEKNDLEIAHQQEIAQLSEKESVIDTLQASLELQTQQFTQIETVLAKQNTLLQQQKEESEQHLSHILEKHHLEVSKLINDLHQSAVIAEDSSSLVTATQNIEPPVTVEKEPTDTPPETNNLKIEEQEENSETKLINDPVLTTEPTPEPEKAPTAPEETITSTTIIEPTLPEPSEASFTAPSQIIPDPFINNEIVAPKQQEPFEPDFITPSSNITGKMKGFFSRSKKEKKIVNETKTEPLSTLTPEKTPDLLAPNEKSENFATKSNVPSKNISGKMKGFFSKSKKETKIPNKIKPELLNTSAPDVLSPSEKTEPFEPDFNTPSFNITGKLKGLLGKKK